MTITFDNTPGGISIQKFLNGFQHFCRSYRLSWGEMARLLSQGYSMSERVQTDLADERQLFLNGPTALTVAHPLCEPPAASTDYIVGLEWLRAIYIWLIDRYHRAPPEVMATLQDLNNLSFNSYDIQQLSYFWKSILKATQPLHVSIQTPKFLREAFLLGIGRSRTIHNARAFMDQVKLQLQLLEINPAFLTESNTKAHTVQFITAAIKQIEIDLKDVALTPNQEYRSHNRTTSRVNTVRFSDDAAEPDPPANWPLDYPTDNPTHQHSPSHNYAEYPHFASTYIIYLVACSADPATSCSSATHQFNTPD
jgi:hypothetical protein